MLNPIQTTLIMIVFIVLFGVCLPILDKIPFISKFVSFRWQIMVVLLAVLLGCVLDFSHLNDNVRHTTIIAILVISGLFIIIRSVEKFIMNGWTLGIDKIKLEHNNTKAEIDINDKEAK